MLYPQTNKFRAVIPICGFYDIKVDAANKGETDKWYNGFEPETQIGVPGSWNEQLSEMGLMDYIGKIWYKCDLVVPNLCDSNRIFIRFGSADMHAKVWVNGQFVGDHSGGYLPFEFDITDYLSEDNRMKMVACIDNTLNHDTIPQGLSEEDFKIFNRERDQTYPSTVFDFLGYGGINRPVKLILLNQYHLESVISNTQIDDKKGIIKYVANYTTLPDQAKVEVELFDGDKKLDGTEISPLDSKAEGEFKIDNCKFWSMENPYLYHLKFKLKLSGCVIDEYNQSVGVRTILVTDKALLLNGKPVFLRGFGKHEDFPILGKGLSYPLIIKDYQLMKWIGANSFRTSHYPYSEEMMYMADKLGFLVIDEVPAVSLNFKFINAKTKENHKKVLKELIARDINHPSVISWSIANEPGIWGEKEAISEIAEKYWQEIYDYVKGIDSSRPITLPTCNRFGIDDLGHKYCDFISINRYWGWYEVPTDIEKAGVVLQKELNSLYKKYNKPIIVTEFGADTLEGAHETYTQMFTEEYQTDLITKYFEVIESLPFMIGEHIWNFADFKTAQNHRRIILNKKGVFNRQRQPKGAAFSIKKHWSKLKELQDKD